MSIEMYFDNIKTIQKDFLNFLDNDEHQEENFQIIFTFLSSHKITEEPIKFKSFINILNIIDLHTFSIKSKKFYCFYKTK